MKVILTTLKRHPASLFAVQITRFWVAAFFKVVVSVQMLTFGIPGPWEVHSLIIVLSPNCIVILEIGRGLVFLSWNLEIPASQDILISVPTCNKIDGDTVMFRSGAWSPGKLKVKTPAQFVTFVHTLFNGQLKILKMEKRETSIYSAACI